MSDGVKVAADWDALAKVLVEALGEAAAEQGQPIWIEVGDPTDTGDEFTLANIVDERAGTLGWMAPERCIALAVVATGKVAVEDCTDDIPYGLSPGVTEGAHLSCIVTREASLGWYMTVPGSDYPVDACPDEGRLLDILRRSLGLGTPPAPDADELDAVMWLGAVLEVAVTSSERLTWTQVQALRPGWSRHAGTAVNWERLRTDAVANKWRAGLLSSEEAAWMDEGMFARWVLDELPLGSDVLAAVRPHLTPSAARRLAHAVYDAC